MRVGQTEGYRTTQTDRLRQTDSDQQRGAGIERETEEDGSLFSSHFSLLQVFSYFPFVCSPGSLGSSSAGAPSSQQRSVQTPPSFR